MESIDGTISPVPPPATEKSPVVISTEQGAEKIKSPQCNLETAFLDSNKPLLSDDTYRQLEITSLCKSVESTEDEEENLATCLRESIRSAPQDPQAIRLRQECIVGLSQLQQKDLKKLEETIEETFASLQEPRFRIMHAEEYTASPENINYDLGLFQSMQNDRQTEETLEALKTLLASLPPTKFIKDLQEYISAAPVALGEFRGAIETSQKTGVLDTLKKYADAGNNEEKQKRVMKEAGVTHSKQIFRQIHEITGLLDKGALKRLKNGLGSLDTLIGLMKVVKKEHLKPVKIVDQENNALKLSDARHPSLVKRLGNKKTVPFSVELTSKEPTVIFTGDNGSGKSICVQTTMLNSILAQATGHCYAEGGTYSPRTRIEFASRLASSRVTGEDHDSTGTREMKSFIEKMASLEPNSMLVLDETLSSTDDAGAISLILAYLEDHAKNGGVTMMTVHSAALQQAFEKGIGGGIQFLKPKSDQEKHRFEFESGVARANTLKFAENLGAKPEVLERARRILKQLSEK